MDIAGITEKPALRSGPYVFAVYSKDAAVISVASSQVERTKPPIPRADLYFFAFSGFSTIDFHASIGFLAVFLASLQSSANSPRTYGYFTRNGLYKYQENVAPRGHPRGS